MRDGVSLRDRKKMQTRIDLVRAAVTLFRAQGYDATTVEEIADKANYSRSTFFRYFAGKEDVVFAELPESLQRIRESTAPLKSGDDPWVVRDMLDMSVGFFMASDRELEAQCVQLWFSEPALFRRYTEIILEWEREIARVFARCWGVDAETSVEAQVVAAALIAVGRQAVSLSLKPEAPDVTDAVHRGYEILDRGFNALQRTPPQIATNSKWRKSRTKS